MHFSKEEIAKRLKEWKNSGKSAWAYSKENGICQQTFAKWVKKEKEKKGGFVEIKAKKKLLKQDSEEIVIEKGDIKIQIPVTTGINELQAIVKALGTVQ